MFRKGQSGNPTGRPPRERDIASLIARALKQKTNDPGTDKRITKARLLAHMLIEAALEGRLTFPDGTTLKLEAAEWTSFVFRLLHHLEGPVPTAHDINLESGINFLFEPHSPAEMMTQGGNGHDEEDVSQAPIEETQPQVNFIFTPNAGGSNG